MPNYEPDSSIRQQDKLDLDCYIAKFNLSSKTAIDFKDLKIFVRNIVTTSTTHTSYQNVVEVIIPVNIINIL